MTKKPSKPNKAVLASISKVLRETESFRREQDQRLKAWFTDIHNRKLDKMRNNRGRANRNDARDAFIYDEAMRGVKWSAIQRSVAKLHNDELTIEGIKKAADRYALRNVLPMPPRRQRGRRKNS